MTDYREKYYELRDAAGRLVDAMGHDSDCAYINAREVSCDCGGWPMTSMLRGELIRLLREMEERR